MSELSRPQRLSSFFARREGRPYSHSMVAGGLLLMS